MFVDVAQVLWGFDDQQMQHVSVLNGGIDPPSSAAPRKKKKPPQLPAPPGQAKATTTVGVAASPQTAKVRP